MGRAVRSHRRWADSAAEFRRASLPSAGACRRPHGAGDDPHAARPWNPSRLGRFYGTHHRHTAERWRAHRRRVWIRSRTRAIHLFRAKAVVLATGGIGRAYKITSNSWEYTGDGHSLAYHAGATLKDMEFVQFHPTGMIWPPSVRGLLVTEGVRGEGGILLNNQGK